MKKIAMMLLMVSLLLTGCGTQDEPHQEKMEAYLVERLEMYENDKLTTIKEYSYNENGVRIGETIQDENGNDLKKAEYHLNENGKINQIVYLNNSGDILETLTYDEEANFIKREVDNEIWEYIYNDQNLMTEDKLYVDNNLIGRTIYSYDKDGKLIRDEYYAIDGTSLAGVDDNYVYDDMGNVSSYHLTGYDNDGKIYQEGDVKYTYSYENDLLSSLVIDYGDLQTSYEYKYDQFHNIIEMHYSDSVISYYTKKTYKTIEVSDQKQKEYCEKWN